MYLFRTLEAIRHTKWCAEGHSSVPVSSPSQESANVEEREVWTVLSSKLECTEALCSYNFLFYEILARKGSM